MIFFIAIVTILFANYMFLRRDKRKMRDEERRNERYERLQGMLRKKENPGGEQTPEG